MSDYFSWVFGNIQNAQEEIENALDSLKENFNDNAEFLTDEGRREIANIIKALFKVSESVKEVSALIEDSEDEILVIADL